MEDQPGAIIILMLVGAFTIGASLANWEFFFTNRKAKFFVNLFGRTGARIFYALLGLGFFGFALYHL